MSKKHRHFSTILNYTEHFCMFVSEKNGCVSISSFASLVGIFIGITSSAIRLLQQLYSKKNMIK